MAPGCADFGSAAKTLPIVCATSRLLTGVGKHVASCFPEPQGAVADGEHRGAHPTALAVAQQVGPRLRGLAEPVGQGDELLGAVDPDSDHHQQAHRVLLQADLEVNPVDPQVDVVSVAQRPLAERGGVVLPLGGEPGDRRGGQPRGRAEELLQRRHEVRAGQSVQVQQRQHLGDLRGLRAQAAQDRRGEPLAPVASSVRLSLTRGARTGTAPAAVATSRSAW